MARAKKAVPLIKRPIAEILDAACNAGATIFTTQEIVHALRPVVREHWINENLSLSDGMSKDEFDRVTGEAAVAFDIGVDSYLGEIADRQLGYEIYVYEMAQARKMLSSRPSPSAAVHAAAMAGARSYGENFDLSLLLEFATKQFSDTLPDAFEGQSEEEFAAFVDEAIEEFERGFNIAIGANDPEEERKAVASTLAENRELRSMITGLDALSQEGFMNIEALSTMVLEVLASSGATRHRSEIATTVRVIRAQALEHMECINREAETVGCNFVEEPMKPLDQPELESERAAEHA